MLVASEKARSRLRWQHSQIAPRADQEVNPAGRKIRIRVLKGLHSIHYSLWYPEP